MPIKRFWTGKKKAFPLMKSSKKKSPKQKNNSKNYTKNSIKNNKIPPNNPLNSS